MKFNESIKWIVPLGNGSIRKRATGTVSGTLDLRTFGNGRVALHRGVHSVSGGAKLYLRHCTASSVLWASATALNTVVSGTTGGGSIAAGSTYAAIAFDVDMAGIGPYLRFKLSTLPASGIIGVTCEGFRGTTNPATDRALVASSGFTTLTQIPSSP